LVCFLDNLIHGNVYDTGLPKVLLHEENSFNRLEPPYRLSAGRRPYHMPL